MLDELMFYPILKSRSYKKYYLAQAMYLIQQNIVYNFYPQTCGKTNGKPIQ